MAKIGFDLDGVLYPFDQALLEHMISIDPVNALLPTPQTWKFYTDWGWTEDQFNYRCHAAAQESELFNCLPPYAGAADAVRKVKAAGHTVHIITARDYGFPGQAESQTVKWLSRYRIPYDTLTFSSDKTAVLTDYYIDDKISNVASFDNKGTNAYLLRRTWNRHCPRDMQTVDSVGAFVARALERENPCPF